MDPKLFKPTDGRRQDRGIFQGGNLMKKGIFGPVYAKNSKLQEMAAFPQKKITQNRWS